MINTGAGLAIGAAIGVGLGFAYDQLALGLTFGAALGAVFDLIEVWSHRRAKK